MHQALFLSNGRQIQSWLAPSSGKLVGRLAGLADATAIAEELYLSLYSRRPTEEERAEVARYLASAARSACLPCRNWPGPCWRRPSFGSTTDLDCRGTVEHVLGTRSYHRGELPMRCSYACGSAEHMISRRSFLGDGPAGLGLASGFSGMVQPAVSAELGARERQVLLVWLAGGASQLETWDPKPGTDTGGPFRSIETSVPGRPDLGAPADDRPADASDGPGARGQHQGRRPRQGLLLDAHRPPRGAGPGVPASGFAGRQVHDLRAKPVAGLRPHSARRGRAERERSRVPRPKYGSLVLGNGHAPANTTRAGSLGEAGATGANCCGTISTTASPTAAGRPRPTPTRPPMNRLFSSWSAARCST